MTRARAGHSLLELLTALALLGVVLAAVLGATLRTWRTHRGFGARADLRAQLEAGAIALATDLRATSAAAGDLAPGAAVDSALELRALVGTGTLCDTASGSLAMRQALAPDVATAPPLPAAGDALWSLVESDTGTAWHRTTLTSARRDATACGTGAVRFAVSDDAWPRPAGAPLRITRLARWSLYRAADGWFLGRRDWLAALARFDVVQPVAGPFDSHATGGLSLHYFDSLGAALPAGTADTRRITRIDLVLQGRTSARDRPDSERVVISVAGHE